MPILYQLRNNGKNCCLNKEKEKDKDKEKEKENENVRGKEKEIRTMIKNRLFLENHQRVQIE